MPEKTTAKANRVQRANQKSPAVRARERELRVRLQAEKPSLDDLIASGDCDPDDIMTMGMYVDVQQALQSLKRSRMENGLSIDAVAERSGLDRAVVSRLENGKQDNPTVATLMRYAAAIGQRFLWSHEELPRKPTAKGRRPLAARRERATESRSKV